MIKTKNISEMLTSLIEEYRFNKNTLSKYLEITEETVDGVAKGNVECLPDDPALRLKILSKAGFLYFGAIEDKDRQLSGFLDRSAEIFYIFLNEIWVFFQLFLKKI
jgi:hypothetical protein